MSFEDLIEPATGPQWQGVLPGRPQPYVAASSPPAHPRRVRVMGTLSGGSERFFQHMVQPTGHPTKDLPPFVADLPRMQAAAQQHDMQFMPDHQWPDA